MGVDYNKNDWNYYSALKMLIFWKNTWSAPQVNQSLRFLVLGILKGTVKW